VKSPIRKQLRTRLTLWYMAVLGVILGVYVLLVLAFQYALVTRQIYHDEVQDVVTVEGLLSFDSQGTLQLQQNYFSHPRSHLLIDRLMEIRDPSGVVLYRSPALNGMSLGGPSLPDEGDESFNERVVRLADGSHAFVISHIHAMQGRTVLIRLGYSLVPFRERMLQFLGILLIAVPITLLLAGFAGYAIAKRALMPLAQMAATAEKITATNLNNRIEIENPDDELGHMGRVLNHLLQRLEEAFVQLQRFTADAAHELRAPLASLRTVGELALREESSVDGYREAVGSILEETSRVNQTIDGLLLLAKAEAAQPGVACTSFSLVELTGEVMSVLEVLVEERQIHVKERGHQSTSALVHSDRGLVRAAIMNILHNAIKFSPIGSSLRIDFANHQSSQRFVELSVQDQGPGIGPSEHEKVFDRFFTSANRETVSMAGSGIGLSLAKLVIERNGGEIFFDPSVSEGARCVVRLLVVEVQSDGTEQESN
jgi:signal transduction histidine kinase